jgi:hypothetical protein
VTQILLRQPQPLSILAYLLAEHECPPAARTRRRQSGPAPTPVSFGDVTHHRRA